MPIPANRTPARRKLLNGDYEIAGNRVSRQLFMWMRIKTSILGNFDTGPGLKNLLTLLLIKHLGRPLFWLRTRLQDSHGIRSRLRAVLPRRDA